MIMNNNNIKKTIGVFFCLIFCLISAFSADAVVNISNDYRKNANWIEVSKDCINSKYSTGDKFIVSFVRTECSNCKYIGTNVFTNWMNDYSCCIYGVDVDSEGINNWAREAAGGGTVSLPLVVFVNNKDLIALQGANDNTVDLMNETFIKFIKEENSVKSIPIINTKSDSVYKGSVVTIIAKVTDIPSGCRLAIFDKDGNLLEKGNQYFIKYTIPYKVKQSQTFVIKIVNNEGLSYHDKEGNEISENIEITVKNSFFDIIIAFFKRIFHSNEIIISP